MYIERETERNAFFYKFRRVFLIHLHIYVHTYIYVCIYICVCIFIYREREGETPLFASGGEFSEHMYIYMYVRTYIYTYFLIQECLSRSNFSKRSKKH